MKVNKYLMGLLIVSILLVGVVYYNYFNNDNQYNFGTFSLDKKVVNALPSVTGSEVNSVCNLESKQCVVIRKLDN